MRFFKKIAGIFGLAKEEDQRNDVKEEENHDDYENQQQQQQHGTRFLESGLPCKGFSVPVQVVVDRSQIGPVLVPSSSGEGGVQGLKWYARRLRVDEDGDVADEFFDEVSPQALATENGSTPRFVIKYNTRPAKIKKQAIKDDGIIQQCIDLQGRLQWV